MELYGSGQYYMSPQKSHLKVCLESVYFIETENFLLKVT